MNSKHNKISPSASQHKLSHYYYQPLSPFNKISTPHRTRVNTSTPSIHTSPINFTTALNYCKSPNDKENAANLLNQSPIMNKFNMDYSKYSNDKNNSPIMMMSKRRSKVTNHAYHKSEDFEPNQQYLQNKETQQHNFEQSLMSLAGKSPRSHLDNRAMMSKIKVSTNFKGILQAQQYQIKKTKQAQEKKCKVPYLKKSFSTSQYNIQLFNSCFQNSEMKIVGNQSIQKNEETQLLCLNNDGNEAKYMTIVNEDNEQRLYYCSKCTVLLVSQGFILEKIEGSQEEHSDFSSQEISQLQTSKDKLKSLINDLEMREAFELDKLHKYYENLFTILSKSKEENAQILKGWYKHKIEEYESILNQLQIFNQSLNNNREKQLQFQSYLQSISRLKLHEPLLKRYQEEDLAILQATFSEEINNTFKLMIKQSQSSKQSEKQGFINRNHGLRFSFEKLLSDISSKKSKMQNFINTLEEQSEQQSDSIQMKGEDKRRNAFRDLFPEGEESSQVNCSVNSPTFKHF